MPKQFLAAGKEIEIDHSRKRKLGKAAFTLMNGAT
jgi:hypothetical protein